MANRIGVFSTCVGVLDLSEAFSIIRNFVGVDLIQVGKLPKRYYSLEGIHQFKALLTDAGLQADAVTIVHEEESYADIEAVRRTVGYLPPQFLEERIRHSCRCIDFAARLGIPTVTTHMGMLPEDPQAPGYARLLYAVSEVASYANSQNVVLALETGQETAEALLTFLGEIPNGSVRVNFDPANIIMYGTGEPLRSLHLLRDHIVGVHIKDALPASSRHQLGREVRPGEGMASLDRCLHYLIETGYAGSFIIENYTAKHGSMEDRVRELRTAKTYVERVLA